LKLSIRHELQSIAGIEVPSTGGSIGISTAVRKYWRKYFSGVQGMAGRNDEINIIIASDYAGAQPIHRFILRSGEPAEIRKSNKFYYVAAIRKNGRHDIIVIQPSYKQTDTSKPHSDRFSDEWVQGVHSGKITKKQQTYGGGAGI
jgi:hypothetical protein